MSSANNDTSAHRPDSRDVHGPGSDEDALYTTNAPRSSAPRASKEELGVCEGLESMMTRCTYDALEYPHLEECGLGSQRATLRSTDPEAPRSDLQPTTLVSNLGTP